VRDDLLPFHMPDVGPAEVEAVSKTLASGWLTSGPKVLEFENSFAQRVGAKHALAVTSCTAALHLALDAIGVGQGDEVIVPTMTFTATAEAAMYLGAVPVLTDVCPKTGNMRVEDIEPKVGPRTKAIMAVHVGGIPCDLSAIHEFAATKNITVIEDAAHAFPTKYRGKWIGSISDLTCFSFYATKTMTTGEGGMLTTSRDDLARRARMMRQHGIDRDAWNRDSSRQAWQYEVLESGFKYNMPDINAALGTVQLRRSDDMRKRRAEIAEIYFQELRNLRGIELPPDVTSPDDQHSWHLFTIKVLPEAKHSRNDLSIKLRERKIGTSVHWIPLHLHPFYQRKFEAKAADFPNGTFLSDCILSLPISSKMTDRDVEDVVTNLKALC